MPGWTPGNDKVLPGFLSTNGRYIVDQRGRKVRLAGISWFGGETDNLSPHGLWSKSLSHFIKVIKDNGYNHIRYPWTNEMLLSGARTKSINSMENPDLVNLTPLEVMDAVINACGKAGLKVYLDRHRPTAAGQSELWYISKVDENKWIEDWKFLAKRYKGNPTVIGADLHNEPHGTACWGCGETKRDWRLAAERCGNAIHQVNPDWLIIVEGNDHYGEEGWQKGESYWWGGMLKGVKQYPVRLNKKNKLVYSAHDYDKNVHLQDWFKVSNFPDNMPSIWDDKWGYIAKQNIAPVLISEFGSLLKDNTDIKWLKNLVSYMKTNGVHWTFWCLNPNSGDTEGILGYDWETVNKQKDGLLTPGKAPNFLI
ncbi:glycoside hydrolase family 5 protein [Piromyces sp. E2]|nr:glycoside hydrolase family 5 protein [Piromyces sp. E2]|eukprot:OUM63634.1 glycoside hydrolase family 5 protein [Piromyces sp. E2]